MRLTPNGSSALFRGQARMRRVAFGEISPRSQSRICHAAAGWGQAGRHRRSPGLKSRSQNPAGLAGRVTADRCKVRQGHTTTPGFVGDWTHCPQKRSWLLLPSLAVLLALSACWPWIAALGFVGGMLKIATRCRAVYRALAKQPVMTGYNFICKALQFSSFPPAGRRCLESSPSPDATVGPAGGCPPVMRNVR